MSGLPAIALPQQSLLEEVFGRFGFESDSYYFEHVKSLKERYKCPHFRILVIGRANAGKTTILEKVCGVTRGTKPVVYDQNGVELPPPPEPKSKSKKKLLGHINYLLGKKDVPKSLTGVSGFLTPTVEASDTVEYYHGLLEHLNLLNFQRGIHNIEHQITYRGSNFLFHDSEGFEAGANKEMDVVRDFIEKKSNATELRDQLHAIWYCIPMEGSRPLLSAELEFFNKGTGNVPLIAVFTKFDALIIQEYVKLDGMEESSHRWDKARENAGNTFKEVYLSKVLRANHPPKGHVVLEDLNMAEKNCPELTEQTANAIDDASLHDLFISTQRNNLDLCVKAALEYSLGLENSTIFRTTATAVFKFPHFWATMENVRFFNEDEFD